MNISFFACFYAISPERSGFSKIGTFIFLALVALKLLSLITRLVACSARIVADRQTDTQNDYCNPRCACAPSVKNAIILFRFLTASSVHLVIAFCALNSFVILLP